jgi:uncharacterized membrane protein YhhN
VTAGASLFLSAALLFAALNWFSKQRAIKVLEHVSKPTTLTLLVIVAVLIHPTDGGVRAWFVAALVLSLLGDVLLMLPKEQFVGGLAAFLLAHVCYIAGFVASGVHWWAVALALVGTAIVVAPVARRILRGVGATEPGLRPPVVAYLVVIATMLACAIASGNAFAIAGAALFVTSDSMIAWDRFVGPFAAAPVGIMYTYHVAQGCLVLSLLH